MRGVKTDPIRGEGHAQESCGRKKFGSIMEARPLGLERSNIKGGWREVAEAKLGRVLRPQ